MTSSTNRNWFENKYVYSFTVFTTTDKAELIVNSKHSKGLTYLTGSMRYELIATEEPFTMLYSVTPEQSIKAVNLIYINREKGE